MARTTAGRPGADLPTDLLMGAVAGAAAIWAMNRLDWFLVGQEPEHVRRQTREARPGGLDPVHLVADKAARALGTRPSPAQPHPAGIAIYYGFGVLMGAAYAALRRRLDWVGAGRGVLFGLAMFLLKDEGLNTLLGTGGPPGRYPWQAHARGAAAHATFGLAADTVLRLLPKPRG